VTSYTTDRRRVEGSGAAHHGAGTWIKERVSSIALVPLSIWGLWSGAVLSGGGYEGFVRWIGSPVNAVLVGLLVLISIYHMQLGLRVVVEDYVHKPFGKNTLLLLNFFVCLVLAFVAVFAILKVALMGGVGA
jgi:succinate dehydrogenase / fumarate reductase, membrane anchor subunit